MLKLTTNNITAMKRISVVIFVLMAMGLTSYADDYLPLLREGVKWVYVEELNYVSPDGDELTFERLYTIEVKGDTVIDNVIYKKIYRTSNVTQWDEDYAEPFCSNFQPVACLREEGTKVYAKVLKDCYYDGLTPFLDGLLYNLSIGKEEVLYEFDEDEDSPCTLIGTTTVGDVSCNVYSCEWLTGEVVEGVGLDSQYCGDLLLYSRSTTTGYPYSYIGLHHVEDADGNIIYYGKAYKDEPVEEPKYDLNGDGLVDVDDVNALINYILNK